MTNVLGVVLGLVVRMVFAMAMENAMLAAPAMVSVSVLTILIKIVIVLPVSPAGLEPAAMNVHLAILALRVPLVSVQNMVLVTKGKKGLVPVVVTTIGKESIAPSVNPTIVVMNVKIVRVAMPAPIVLLVLVERIMPVTATAPAAA